MSFSSNIDQDFSMDPDEHRADFMRKFGTFQDLFTPSQSNSFFRRINPFEGYSSPSENHVVNIPIKVEDRREGEEIKNQTFLEEFGSDTNKTKSETSSNTSFHREALQPKVHRIPIHFESRKENPIKSQNKPICESSPSTSLNSQISNSSSNQRSQSKSPNRQENDFEFDYNQNKTETCRNAKVHNIPIQIERDVNLKEYSVSSSPESKKSIKPQALAPLPGQAVSIPKKTSDVNVTSAPAPLSMTPVQQHVTHIPISTDEPSHSPKESDKKPASAPVLALPAKKDPLELVKEVDDEINKLKLGVDYFNGDQRLSLWLDEMLTRCMLKLDNIDGEGREDVRQARKAALALIDKTLATLEEKVKNPPPLEKEEEEKSSETKDNENDQKEDEHKKAELNQEKQEIENNEVMIERDDPANENLQENRDSSSANTENQTTASVAIMETQH